MFIKYICPIIILEKGVVGQEITSLEQLLTSLDHLETINIVSRV